MSGIISCTSYFDEAPTAEARIFPSGRQAILVTFPVREGHATIHLTRDQAAALGDSIWAALAETKAD